MKLDRAPLPDRSSGVDLDNTLLKLIKVTGLLLITNGKHKNKSCNFLPSAILKNIGQLLEFHVVLLALQIPQ